MTVFPESTSPTWLVLPERNRRRSVVVVLPAQAQVSESAPSGEAAMMV
jgi:hypothetical protein